MILHTQLTGDLRSHSGPKPETTEHSSDWLCLPGVISLPWGSGRKVQAGREWDVDFQ